MAYTLILFGPIVWSCGPAQVFGLVTAPYAAYKYFTAKDEKEVEDVCDSLRFNLKAMIPFIGTWIAINDGDTKRQSDAKRDFDNQRQAQSE